jgi:hypothetical protein
MPAAIGVAMAMMFVKMESLVRSFISERFLRFRSGRRPAPRTAPSAQRPTRILVGEPRRDAIV